ncbi:hypothetical protein HDU92_006612 [Lobulomyces angularis]|nr:hypothetical protein HDU92_006612 [Lobulomyces angularis]
MQRLIGVYITHEEKNVRCVEKAGQAEINSVDLISGDWTVEMINLDTFAVVASTKVKLATVQLKKFSLQLPVARSDGKMTIISNELLNEAGFSYPPYFQLNSEKNAWVLHTSVWFQVATAGKYTRTELRKKENWNIVTGLHSFSSLQSIDSVS